MLRRPLQTTRAVHDRLWRHDDTGLTLVEMMVAILLLAIILSALVSVIVTSLTSLQRDERRVRATQLAQEELERLRALEWDCVAFDTTDPDYTASYNGNTTVDLDPAECSDPTIAPDPSPRTVTIDGIDYTVTPHVYWIDDPQDGTAAAGTDGEPEDYKEFEVEVAWTLRGEVFAYSDTSTRVPTIEEVPLAAASAAPAFAITSLTIDPLIVDLTSGTTDQPIIVTVDTSSAATLVELTVLPPATYGTATLADISSGAGTRWRLTIPPGSTAFPAGDHEFQIAATGVSGADTASQAVTFAETSAPAPVVVNTPLLSPSICVANNGNTHTTTTVTIDVDGLSLTDEVTVSWTDKSGSATAVGVTTTASGARFEAAIPAGHKFNKSTTTVTVNARRISDNAVAAGSFVFDVTKESDPDDCPA